MRKPKHMRIVGRALLITVVTMVSGTAAADIEKAQLLYDAQLYDDAKRELIAIAVSEADQDEKSAALHLLGTIAVDEKRYEAALSTWSDLVTKYPDTHDALLVEEKMPLVRTLAEQKAPASTQVTAASSTPTELSGVIVVGSGPEADLADLAIVEISNFLIGNDIDSSAGLDHGTALAELKPLASESGVSSFLVLTMKFGYMESLRAECYLGSGELQWKEKASGSWGFGKERIATGLIERMKEKLEERLGDSCLPRDN